MLSINHRTLVDLTSRPMEELEAQLGNRLRSDQYLSSILEELCIRQIDKEHSKLESCSQDNCAKHQGFIRGTRYFLELRERETLKMEGLDRSTDEA